MPFFSPGGLGSTSSTDPQFEALLAQLKRAYPHVFTEGQQPPRSLASLGYQWSGPTLQPNQGASPMSLPLFESSGAVNPESITGQLATGSAGRTSYQLPNTGNTSTFQAPQFQIPGVPQVDLAQFSTPSTETGLPLTGNQAQDTGQGGPGLLDVLGAGQNILNYFPSGPEAPPQQVSNPTGATVPTGGLQFGTGAEKPTLPPSGVNQTLSQQPGLQFSPEDQFYAQTGARDWTWASGSPAGLHQFTPDQIAALGELGINTDVLAQRPTPSIDVTGGAKPGLPLGPEPASASGATFQTPDLSFNSFLNALGLGAGTLNTVGGIQAGNPLQVAGGVGQTVQGAVGLLGPQNMNALAQTINSALGVNLSGTQLAAAANVPGGLLSLYGLYQGIQAGDPVQIASSVLGIYQGASSVAQLAGQPAFPGITDLISQIPGVSQGMSALNSALGIGAAGAGTIGATGVGVGAALGPIAQGGATAAELAAMGATGAELAGAITPALSAVSAWAGPVAAVIQAVMDSIAETERSRIRNAGFTNNPIKGALYSGSTAGVLNANQILERLMQGGNVQDIPTLQLGDALTSSINNLLPYYATAQGGRGAIRASDTITGAGADTAAKPWTGGQTPEEYTANFTRARTGVESLVNELLRRGVPYEAIGQLPVTGDWTQQSLDAGGTPDAYLNEALRRHPEFASEAPHLANRYRISPFLTEGGDGIPPQFANTGDIQQALLNRVLGSSMLAPEDVTHASGLYTSMYGGPTWAALARMGVADPQLQELIKQNFDPWVNARGREMQIAWQPQIQDFSGMEQVGPDLYRNAGGELVGVDRSWRSMQDFSGMEPIPGRPGFYLNPHTGETVGTDAPPPLAPAPPPDYWDALLQQQADAARQQITQQFSGFNTQLQDYLVQAQQAGLMPASAPAAPMPQLGPDWAATWATLDPQRRQMLGGIGLDPELLRQLGWQI